jgi:hypothetical protein
MSYFAQAWAEEAPVADVYERAIITLMSHRARNDGTGAYPSVKTMSRYALCDEKTIERRVRALRKRRMIALGDQALAQHLPADKRPQVYDLQIPFSWYSAAQLGQVNRERADRGAGPLTETDRPPLPPAPPRKTRADRGTTRTRAPRTARRQPSADDGSDDPAPAARPAPAPEPAGGLQVPSAADLGPSGEGTTSPLAGGLQVPGRGDYKTPNTVLERETVRGTAGGPPPAPPDCLGSQNRGAEATGNRGRSGRVVAARLTRARAPRPHAGTRASGPHRPGSVLVTVMAPTWSRPGSTGAAVVTSHLPIPAGWW